MHENGRPSRIRDEFDPHPVVKLFTRDAACTWLLTEIDDEQPTLASAFCDLGRGSPELGYVPLNEVSGICGPRGLGVETFTSSLISRSAPLQRLRAGTQAAAKALR